MRIALVFTTLLRSDELYVGGTSMKTSDISRDRDGSVFELCPLPMWTYDRSTLRFLSVNAAAVRQYGFTHAEFMSMTLADIRPFDDVAALENEIRQTRGFADRQLWRHRRKDGSIITAEITATDFEVDGRNVRLVLANDVTQREVATAALRKTEEQLRHAQKMDAIGRLAGGVCHDLNNILTVVQSYACMLEESIDTSDARHQDAVEIRHAVDRATTITRQLLVLSRNSATQVESLDVNEVVAMFAATLQRVLGAQIALVVHRVDVPLAVADRGQLEQVVMNLAINARDAMPDGGRLTIETQVVEVDHDNAPLRGLNPGRYVELALTDTGTGIDADTLGRLFEPFFTTKPVGRGTGLGLSIVHGIVTQAGGNVAVYSELGHGTTVRVHLPVTDATITAAAKEPSVAPRDLPPVTVLVVDDDLNVRAVAGRILQDAGCRVLDAATAEEARRICVRHDGTIDLALSDVVLADGRGDRLADQLAEFRPSMKMLLMSGYPAGALSSAGGEVPDLLAKPFSPSELRAAVARVLGLDGGGRASAPRRSEPRVRPKVLLADDDDMLRNTLTRVLRKGDLDVVEVASGRAAIAELSTSRFDVIVSDVHMPDGTGLDLLRNVRRIDLDVPVILLTGSPDIATATSAIEYGAFRFLTKPVDNDTLLQTVAHAARAFALARIRREAFSITGGAHAAVDRAGLEVRFELALDKLWIAFQPIIDAKTGALMGVEALMRSDESSMASPQVLLDTATQLERLPQLGRRVRTVAAGSVNAHPDNADLYVNLHPEDLIDADLVDEGSLLTSLAPRVVLEITERASLTSSRELSERLARLRALGFRIAVDDIGAGYSGLTSFTELQPEIVKIDMSLVRDVHQSALKQRVIGALCKLCHDNGAMIVGEGVETIAERECLMELGCDLLQGYLIGRPVRAGSASAF